LCRREGIDPTRYYGWKKQLLASAGAIFDTRSQSPVARRRGWTIDDRRVRQS
jgi:hypothetical protein